MVQYRLFSFQLTKNFGKFGAEYGFELKTLQNLVKHKKLLYIGAKPSHPAGVGE